MSAPQFAFTVFIIGCAILAMFAVSEALIWLLEPVSVALTRAP
jgi:hypothetical protein